ncbi:hypothetical protein Mgra_00009271 [Meloidogyne graminicola]|uniref:Uncharacterized protein n=1 Tax=Meloidogyne graminicola TaxID=189291 RepID=A0A8S9ZDE8_9BILA|nr:hypothetical protein Mgra_00009271 [Meloidogyne graminicola]
MLFRHFKICAPYSKGGIVLNCSAVNKALVVSKGTVGFSSGLKVVSVRSCSSHVSQNLKPVPTISNWVSFVSLIVSSLAFISVVGYFGIGSALRIEREIGSLNEKFGWMKDNYAGMTQKMEKIDKIEAMLTKKHPAYITLAPEFVEMTVEQEILVTGKNSLNDFSNRRLGQVLNKMLDEGVWKYEHLRQFCSDLNGLAVLLQDECTPETCNQMTATDQWIFLCAAHKNPKECSAIDYTRHTLDGAAALLNSNRYFPSRITIKESSIAKIGSICRRIYRIFSHAYFHHRTLFNIFEEETFLCKRFTKFVLKYQLMANDNLIVPI